MKLSTAHLATTLALLLPAYAHYPTNYVGCYTTFGTSEDVWTFTFQATSHCKAHCQEIGTRYFALQDDTCWCDDSKPSGGDLVSDDKCDTSCPGWPRDICGGDSTWSFYSTGLFADDSTDTDTTTTDSGAGTLVATLFYGTSSTVLTGTTETGTATTSTETSSVTSTASEPTSEPESTSSTASTSLESGGESSSSAAVTPTPTTSNANRRYSFLW